MKKKILIINPWVGLIGPNTFIDGFIRESLEIGNDLTVLYPYADDISKKFENLGCTLIYLNILKLFYIKNILFRASYRLFVEIILTLILPFLIIFKKYDSWLVNTELLSFSLIFPSFFVKLNLVVHSLSFKQNILNGLIFKTQQLAVFKYITVSNAVKNSLIDCGISKPIQMVYNGIEIPTFTSNEQTDLTKGYEKIKIISIIHSLPHKGAHHLLEVLKIFTKTNKNIECNVFGWGNSAHDKNYQFLIEQKVKEYHLQSFINFNGSINNIYNEYRNSDIMLHPSENESFGYVLVEAMAFELPVVAFSMGGMKEIVIDRVTGKLIEPYNINQMADELLILCNDKKLRKSYGEKGRKIVFERFNRNKNMKLVINNLDNNNFNNNKMNL